MSRTGQLATGLALTTLAGYVDALGFIRLGGLYTSFMSGNTTQLGVYTAQGESHHVLLPLLLLGAFLIGAILGSGLAILVPARWSTPAVLAYETAMITVALGVGLTASELGLVSVFLATAMGAQNATLSQVKGFRAAATFVTGALFTVGQRVAQALTRTGDPFGWVGDGLVWLSLLVGAFLGAHAYGRYELYALVPPAVAAAGLALVTAIAAARSSQPASASSVKVSPP